ncbi:MAG: hypothetical protein M9944_14065 [Rhizobiaceae bacterium]|nr:hypothetical protein [Rhizobiaceae bacterium]
MDDLAALVAENEDAAAAIASAYEILLGGVPNVAGFTFLIENALATNYGSNDASIEFNQENVFINVFNALVQGNTDAAAAFSAITAGSATLIDKVTAIYETLFPVGVQSAEGLAYVTRPEALAFYAAVAAERGVAGPDGAAIVALASMMNVAYENDTPGIGDATNDLIAAILDGSAELPLTGNEFTPIEVADGTNFDGDDDIGISITLTDRIDAPGIDESQPGSGRDTTGTDGNDVYTASALTLNPGDIIDGKGGEDTLILNLVDQGLTILDFGVQPWVPGFGLVVNLPLFEVESMNLENIVVQLEGGNDILDNVINPPLNPFVPILAGAEIDLSRSSDITDLSLQRSAGIVKFSDIQNNVDINIMDSVGWFTYVFDNGAVGADATLMMNVEDVFAIIEVEANGGDSFSDLVLNTTGGNILMIGDNWDVGSLPLESLTVTGTGTNILISGFVDPDLNELVNNGVFVTNEFTNLTNIDLSGNSGGTAIELLFNMEDLTYVGGSGNDIALFGSDAGGGYVNDDDSFDGGAGYDILGFGGDDLVGLSGDTVQNFELFALFNDASGDDFKFENSNFNVDIGLFADWNATLTLEDFDDNTLYVWTDQNVGTVIAFDDTDVANISVQIPVELMPYVDLGLDALDELGLDAFIPLITGASGGVYIDDVNLSEVTTANFETGGELLATETYLEVGNITLDGTTGTIAAMGSGDFQIDAITLTNAGDDDGLVFDLLELTRGFDNGGAGNDVLIGAQTYLIGALGETDTGDLINSYDFDGDATDDDSSVINFGVDAAYDPDANAATSEGDGSQDFAIFTADFGNVAIENFTAWNVAGVAVGEQDILDFTALGVDELTDLSFTDVADGVVITSGLFDGSVLLVGLSAVDLSNENFDFVA